MTQPDALWLTWLLAMLGLLMTKHFFADYALQTRYTLRKDNVNHWRVPLMVHAGVHGLLTTLVMLPFVGPMALLWGSVDMALHGVIDGCKSRWARYHQFDKRFWIAHGLDQLLHHLTYVAITYFAILGHF
jgi:hypothetical protein